MYLVVVSGQFLFFFSLKAAHMNDKTGGAGAGSAEDEELSVPRASVNKMIRELAPALRIC